MVWRRSGDKPLSEAMMVRLPTHICVTRPQWVKTAVLHWTIILFMLSVTLILAKKLMPIPALIWVKLKQFFPLKIEKWHKWSCRLLSKRLLTHWIYCSLALSHQCHFVAQIGTHGNILLQMFIITSRLGNHDKEAQNGLVQPIKNGHRHRMI